MLTTKMSEVLVVSVLAFVGVSGRLQNPDQDSAKRVVAEFVQQDLRGARTTPEGVASMSRLVSGSRRIALLTPNSIGSVDVVTTHEISRAITNRGGAQVALEYAVIGTVDEALRLKRPKAGPILMRQTVTLVRDDGRWVITGDSVPSPAVSLTQAVKVLERWRGVSPPSQQKNLEQTLEVLEQLCRKPACSSR